MKINRADVYAKFNGHCAYCGEQIEFKQMQVDHLLPQYWLSLPNPKVTKEQVYSFNNLMPACRACNKYKDTYSIETFRAQIEAQIERLRKYQSTFRLAEKYKLIECKPAAVVLYFETYGKP